MNESNHQMDQIILESWETLPQLPTNMLTPKAVSNRRRLHDLSCGLRTEYESAVALAKAHKTAEASEKALHALRDAIIAIEAWHGLNNSF